MKYPVIGSKFTGKNLSLNTQTGEFWSVLPDISSEEVTLQRALLKRVPSIVQGAVLAAAAEKAYDAEKHAAAYPGF